MGVVVSQITANLTSCSSACSLIFCDENPSVTGEFPSQRANNTDIVSITCNRYHVAVQNGMEFGCGEREAFKLELTCIRQHFI